MKVRTRNMGAIPTIELAWFLALAFSPFLVGFSLEDQFVKRICINLSVYAIEWFKRIFHFVLTLPLFLSIRSVRTTFLFGLGIISVSLLPFVISSTVILLPKDSMRIQVDEVRDETLWLTRGLPKSF